MTVQMLKLVDCITLTKGKPPAEIPYFGNDAEPYLRPEYLRGKGTAEPAKPAANAVRVKDGDTIVLWDGSNAGEFFRARDGLLASTMSLIKHSEEFEPEYFCYAAKRWETYLKGQTSGSGIPHVDKEVLGKLEILKLPPDEQKLAAYILNKLDRAIKKTEVLIAKQQRIKTGLMQDLLTKGIDEHGSIRSEVTHAFKDSPLGRIPVQWSVSKLSMLTTKIVDGVHHTPTYVETGVPFLTISDLTAGDGICFDNVRCVTQSDHNAFTLRADPTAGDVLVTKDGTLGVARIVPEGCPMFSIFVSVAQLRPKKETCTPELIWSFFEGGEFKIQLGALSAGTGLAHIHLEHFREFLLRVPPIQEQGRIFQVISQHHNAIRTNSATMEKLRAMKQGVMHDLLTGERRVTPLLAQVEKQ